MKKILPVIIVIIILLAGGLGYYLYSKSQKSKSALETGVVPTKIENQNVFTSIQDALSKSLSLQCTFTDDQNRKTTAYIKAGAVRADSEGIDSSKEYNSSSVIIKDKKIYIWDTIKKQGMVMEMKQEQTQSQAATGTNQQQTQTQNQTSSQNGEDIMATLEKYKKDCKVVANTDSLFTPPTDVKFQDLSQMMAPTSATAPSGMSQQQVQEMMQKYQQQAPTGY